MGRKIAPKLNRNPGFCKHFLLVTIKHNCFHQILFFSCTESCFVQNPVETTQTDGGYETFGSVK